MHRYVSSPDSLTWQKDPEDPVRLVSGGAGPFAADTDRWLPETVVWADGEYLAWYATPDGLSPSAIYFASSSDGVVWNGVELPALEADSTGWDADGLNNPNVTQVADGYFLMAYGAQRFGEGPSVGLASSTDGTVWVRHQSNPIVHGDLDDFDAGGITPGTVLFQHESTLDSYIVLWHQSRSTTPIDCPGVLFDSDGRERLSVTLIEFGPNGADAYREPQPNPGPE